MKRLITQTTECKLNWPGIMLFTITMVLFIFNSANVRGQTTGTPIKSGETNILPNSELTGENLTPYQPSGWDSKIVVSTVTGTHTSSTVMYPTDNLYIDWAVINNGTANVTATFYTRLYVDGVLRYTWSTGSLPANYYTLVNDYSIGTLTPGFHTLRIVTDATGLITETNEGDNEYSRTRFITGPNLTPYQPSGWDNKIVISNGTGTHTSSSTIFNTQTIYVDWAIINNGSLASGTTTFYTRLYVDGALRYTVSTNNLSAGGNVLRSDYSIGTLAPGSHTFQIVTDATNLIRETSETDNSYSRTITVYPNVNLTTYQPAGWDNKIVLSTVTGTNTSAATIYDTDNIYLDWSIINLGSSATSTTFIIDLHIDGAPIAYWSRPGIGAGIHTSNMDYLVGKLPAGNHTFTIRVDDEGDVPETNEGDNTYVRQITVVNRNLTPYQPSGWDNKIVVSTGTGTHTSTSPVFNTQTLYVDWAVINNGTASINTTFYTRLYVDGVLRNSWSFGVLTAGAYLWVADYNLGVLAAGTHTISIVTDATGTVVETNEADNGYSRLISVLPNVNLTPYQLGGWDDKIVLSTVTGTNTSASEINDSQPVYLDWAIINNGPSDISGTFYIRLYVDDILKVTWTKTGLNHNIYTYCLDQNVGTLTAGTHTFKIVADATGTVTETNEADNEYLRTITVISSGSTLGNTEVYGSSSTTSNRRAIIVTFPEAGSIKSVSIYHNGGTGRVLLGVYADVSGSPVSRLGATPETIINSSAGWQTISLMSPITVTAGQKVWLSWVFENNPGIRYVAGTPARAQSSQSWAGGMPNPFGAATFDNYKYSVYCTYVPGGGPVTKTLGNTEVYSLTSTTANRRAQTVTFPEAGTIQSISIYHNGGTGQVLLGVYADASGSPAARLGVTPATTINGAAGWQTISLTSPVSVTSGRKVWLSWVFQTNPGIRYVAGTPSRAESPALWSGGMPDPFGTSTFANYKYSIYCTYTTGGGPETKTLGNTEIYSLSSTTANRRAQTVTFPEAGTIQSISIYHNGGTGHVLLGVYADASGNPGARLGVTASTVINASAGWQTIPFTSSYSASAGQKVWIAWVFENNPGIRYVAGTPARAESASLWSGGMPDPFGTASFANYKYSIYCTYTSTGGDEVKSVNEPLDVQSMYMDKEEVLIYPNPTEGNITVTWKNNYGNKLDITIYNILGKAVKVVQTDPDVNEIRLDLNDQSNGAYLFEMKDKKNDLILNRSMIIKK